VSSQAGVVTLQGRVPVEGLRSRAEAVAAEVGTRAEKDLAGMLAREGAGAPLDNLVEVGSGAQ
jgi:osmotically-inducible protein OsmY